MKESAPSSRVRVRRSPRRALYERTAIDAILDEALCAHVAFVQDGQPYAIPCLHARVGDVVYLHGATSSRAFRTLGSGAPACLTVTLLDGLVVARSLFHNAMNYRSVVMLGAMSAVAAPDEHGAAVHALSERLVPGSIEAQRGPTRQELKATRILVMPIDELSAKVRRGPPEDDPDDISPDAWAGVIPMLTTALRPVADEHTSSELAVPSYVSTWRPTASRR